MKFCLIGNPNSGKSSIFNCLTGLNQKTGNFSGVTVEKKEGSFKVNNIDINIVDLPGTYSLYPRKDDETICISYLINLYQRGELTGVIFVADACNLKRNLLLCSQIIDLKIPVVLVLTMTDLSRKKGIKIDEKGLSDDLTVPLVLVNPLKNKGIAELKNTLLNIKAKSQAFISNHFYENYFEKHLESNDSSKDLPDNNLFLNLYYLINPNCLNSENNTFKINGKKLKSGFSETKIQAEDILERYQKIQKIVKKNVLETTVQDKRNISDKIDNLLIHKRWGYLFLALVLIMVFQAIFWLADFPMQLIELFFFKIQKNMTDVLPQTWWASLINNGLLSGLSGIAVFIPQIMILFGLIMILEDSGYMARISFLMDRLFKKVGLNGKSIMPMISGFACAVPAIISCRTMENKKEKLLTIFITPLMSCSARIPVYSIIISLMIEEKKIGGFLSFQGLIMMLFYLLGVVLAFIVALILKKLVKSKEKSYFILELPIYKIPRWNSVFYSMISKASLFIKDAGKIILLLSLILWFLGNFGPRINARNMNSYQQDILNATTKNADSIIKKKAAVNLENSYIGILGKFVEPIFSPLGFDWKIDIALISSFAAREVFVGTMVTLYSTDDNSPALLKSKMQTAKNYQGNKIYSIPTCLALLVFYAIALQCLSTFVTTYRELKSLKWAMIQFASYGILAYFTSWLTYNIASVCI